MFPSGPAFFSHMTGSATLDTFSSCHPSILLFLWDELLGRLGFLGVIGSAVASIIVATGGVIIEGITSAVRRNLSSAGCGMPLLICLQFGS